MSSPSSQFIQDMFLQYYRERSTDIQPPPSIEKREFGFFMFKERIMLRHKGFQNIDELRSYVKQITPSDVYHSGAYYERPEAEMDEKGWLGADLIFDIDADHIPTPCAKVHDTWICTSCGAVGRGITPQNCPACEGQKFEEKTWPCEVCLASAKAETVKLIDFLMKDFGFSSKTLKVFFSGHRGYHLHMEGEEVHELGQTARSEIVDYLLGVGLEPAFHGLMEEGPKKRTRILGGPDLSDPGWKGRIAKGTYDLLLNSSQEELEKIGLKRKDAETLIKNRESLLGSWKKRGPWGAIKGISAESWRKLAERGVEKQSAKIDTVVTTDIHRLIRLNNTLHGKTGLKKTEVPLTGIEQFDPFKSAVAFEKGKVSLFVSDAPQFRLRDEIYGPYKNQKVELPTAATMLLLCKGLARLEEGQ